MSFKLESKGLWVLITGASRGIGEVFADRFAKQGCNLILVARAQDKLNELAKSLESKYQIKTEVIAADLKGRGAPAKIAEHM